MSNAARFNREKLLKQQSQNRRPGTYFSPLFQSVSWTRGAAAWTTMSSPNKSLNPSLEKRVSSNIGRAALPQKSSRLETASPPGVRRRLCLAVAGRLRYRLRPSFGLCPAFSVDLQQPNRARPNQGHSPSEKVHATARRSRRLIPGGEAGSSLLTGAAGRVWQDNWSGAG
jgi:hypothetical protein